MLRATVPAGLRHRCTKVPRWLIARPGAVTLSSSAICRQKDVALAKPASRPQIPNLDPAEGMPLPMALQSIYFQPLRREAKYGVPVCDLQLRSFNVRNLEFFCDFAMRAAYYLNIPAALVPLPRRTERWTVPKSNFVHKKSQQNFERVTYRRLIQLKDASPESIELWLAFLSKHEYHGIGMKANVWTFEAMNTHSKLDKILSQSLPNDPRTPKWAAKRPGKLIQVVRDLMEATKAPPESEAVLECEAATSSEGAASSPSAADHISEAPVVEHEARSLVENTPAKDGGPQKDASESQATPSEELAPSIVSEDNGRGGKIGETEEELEIKKQKEPTAAPVAPLDGGNKRTHSATPTVAAAVEESDTQTKSPSEAPAPDPTPSEEAVAADYVAKSADTIETGTVLAKEVQIEQNLKAPDQTGHGAGSAGDGSSALSGGPPPPEPTLSEEIVAADHVTKAPDALKDPVLAKEVQINEGLDIEVERIAVTTPDKLAQVDINTARLAKKILSESPTESEEIVVAESSRMPLPIPNPTESEEIIKVIVEAAPVSAGWPDGMSIPQPPPAKPVPKIKTTPADAAGAAVQSDGLPFDGVAATTVLEEVLPADKEGSKAIENPASETDAKSEPTNKS